MLETKKLGHHFQSLPIAGFPLLPQGESNVHVDIRDNPSKNKERYLYIHSSMRSLKTAPGFQRRCLFSALLDWGGEGLEKGRIPVRKSQCYSFSQLVLKW